MRPRIEVAPCKFCRRRFARREHLLRHERTRALFPRSNAMHIMGTSDMHRYTREAISLPLWQELHETVRAILLGGLSHQRLSNKQ